MTGPGSHWLLISLSGRALAASAWHGGSALRVLDAFADQDTRVYAQNCAQLPVGRHGFLDTIFAPGWIADKFNGKLNIVAGSGFEFRPALLDELALRGNLFSNPAELIASSNNPFLLSKILNKINVKYPEVRQSPPKTASGWLRKTAGSCGGAHVRCFQAGMRLTGHYLQRRVPGSVCSVVWLADGRRACLLGCSQLLQRAPEQGDFRYAGALSRRRLPGEAQRRLPELLNSLVQQTGARGLCGLDLIVTPEGELYVLELNLRPPASFELFDQGPGLFALHVQACRGLLPRLPGEWSCPPRALALCYAPCAVHIPGTCRWPDWVRDRPHPGSRIPANAPVCTVYAGAATERLTGSLLYRRYTALQTFLYRCSDRQAGDRAGPEAVLPGSTRIGAGAGPELGLQRLASNLKYI